MRLMGWVAMGDLPPRDVFKLPYARARPSRTRRNRWRAHASKRSPDGRWSSPAGIFRSKKMRLGATLFGVLQIRFAGGLAPQTRYGDASSGCERLRTGGVGTPHELVITPRAFQGNDAAGVIGVGRSEHGASLRRKRSNKTAARRRLSSARPEGTFTFCPEDNSNGRSAYGVSHLLPVVWV